MYEWGQFPNVQVRLMYSDITERFSPTTWYWMAVQPALSSALDDHVQMTMLWSSLVNEIDARS